VRRLIIGALMLASLVEAAVMPRRSPELVITGTTGAQTLLSQYKGHPILLFFFFTTCPHCQYTTTNVLNPIMKEYAGRGLHVIGVAFNENSQLLINGFKQQYQPAFPLGTAPRDAVVDYLAQPANQPLYVPTFVFIDRNFEIQGEYIGNDPFFKDQDKNTREMVEKILAARHTGGSRSRSKKK
jgi:thiol-disulfide isomerase/thioredoxin